MHLLEGPCDGMPEMKEEEENAFEPTTHNWQACTLTSVLQPEHNNIVLLKKY